MGEEKTFVSDSMSPYIYTDMAPELHIKINLSQSNQKKKKIEKKTASSSSRVCCAAQCEVKGDDFGGSYLVWRTTNSHFSTT